MIAGTISIELAANVARIAKDMDQARGLVSKATSAMGKAAGIAGMALGALAGALSISAFSGWIRGAIDAADSAGKLSQKTGIAVKDLAGIQLAYQQAGVGTEAMSTSMSRLSKGIVEGSKTLDALGVKSKNIDGTFRGTKDVLYSVADGFAGMQNGAQKTALAMELFGKSGADMIPLLNGGSQSLREMDEMARKLGLTMSEETAANAEKFNDTLDLLSMGGQGVARGIAAELLPTLNSLAGSFLQSMTEGDKLAKTAEFLGTTMKILFTVGVGVVEVFSTVGKVLGGVMAGVTTVLGGYAGVLTKLVKGDFSGAMDAAKASARDFGTVALAVGADVMDGWKSTAKTITSAWDGSGAAAVEAMGKIKKGEADLLAAAKAREAAAKKAAQEYAAALKAAEGFLDSLRTETSQIGKNAAELKMMAAERAAAKAPTEALRNAILLEASALNEATVAWDAKTRAEKADAESQKALSAATTQVNDRVKAMELEVASHGLAADAVVRAEKAKLEAKLAAGPQTYAEMIALDAQIAGLEKLIVLTQQKQALDTGSDVTKAKELLDILVAVDQATKSAADGMAASFGRVGSAIGGLTVALSEYGVRQQAIVAQLAAAKAKPENHDKIAKLEIAAAHASAQAKIKSYGDMASAAKGFFKENSRGYKVMEGVEKAYRATEMAMAIQTMLTKSGLVQAFTGLFVASKSAETAATVASVGPDVAASMAKGTAAAAVGVAQQAQGDPYTAWPRMAAMAAVMAALGFAVAGASKGDTTAKDRQAATGTGSVLGDSSAKSQSIARAIEISASNSNIELGYTSRMLRALLSIENSMLNLGGLLLRNGDVGGALPGKELGGAASFASSSKGQLVLGGIFGAALNKLTGGWIGKVTGQVANAIFGGNVKTLDGGIMASATSLGNARNGAFMASSYVDTKKDGGWFRSDKYRTATTSLGDEANQQFSLVLANMATAVSEAGKLLGLGGDAFTQRLNAFVVDIGKISTKDLKPEEIQKQIEAAFSKVGDDMARWSVAGITQFQKVGEGALETLVRVASNYANLDSILQSVGMTFGATGLASIEAREGFIALVGGIDELAGKAAEFGDNFLTEAERLAPVQKYVTEQLAAMNLAHLNSRDAFKGHLLSLNPAIAAEREQIAALLDLQGAFAKLHAATEDLSKSQQEIADERAELQKQIEQFTLTEIQLLAKRRAELDPSNRLLFDQVEAMRSAREAQDAAKTSMSGLIDRMKSFGDSARSLRDGLLMGGLSTLTLEQQYAEARRQRDTTLAAAMGGDTTAQGNLSAMQTAFLTISQKVNGGDARYSSDFAEVLRISDDVAKWSTGQIDTAQASLNVMNDQLAQLVQMNSIMQSLADAAGVSPIANVGVPDYSTMGAANTTALVNEVKALRTSNEALTNEVKALRTDQKQQTGDLIVAAEQISNREAEAVTKGVGAALGRGRNEYANGVSLV